MSRIRRALDELIGPGGQYEIVVEDVGGAAVRTFAERPGHVAAIAERAEAHEGEFLVGPEVRLTFTAAFDRSRRLASLLRDRGITPGDRVAVVGANAVDWVIAYWAGLLADAVVVPVNAWWGAGEMGYVLEDAGVALCLCDEPRSHLVRRVAGADPIVWGPDGDIDALEAFEPFRGEGPLRGEDDPAVLFYTSGTTGRPKGVPLSHRNVLSGFLNSVAMTTAARRVSGEEGGGRQIDLCVIPLFHATANLAIMVPFAAAGHGLVFLPPGRFDPEAAAAAIAREGITRFGGVPTIVNRMLAARVWERHDLSSVRRISYGGAPASRELPAAIADAFPNVRGRVIQGYGLTETAAIATLNQGEDYESRPGSVGIAAPTVELRIASDEGSPLPAGAEGEILIRGGNVFAGYWNRAEDRPFTDGFFHTGDVGYLDEDGFLYITDRAKDVIVRGGENVASAEVEEALDAHPGVVESAVVGAPDADLGEVVRAIVVVSEPVPTEEELHAHLSARLAAYKVPAIWELRTEPLPRNPAGKVMKALLRGSERAVFAAGGDSAL